MSDKSNSARLNDAFAEIGKALAINLVAIRGDDGIGQGTNKIVSNLESIGELLRFDAHGNPKINGKEWFDRFITALDEKGRDSSKGVTVFTEDVIIEAARKAAGIDNG